MRRCRECPAQGFYFILHYNISLPSLFDYKIIMLDVLYLRRRHLLNGDYYGRAATARPLISLMEASYDNIDADAFGGVFAREHIHYSLLLSSPRFRSNSRLPEIYSCARYSILRLMNAGSGHRYAIRRRQIFWRFHTLHTQASLPTFSTFAANKRHFMEASMKYGQVATYAFISAIIDAMGGAPGWPWMRANAQSAKTAHCYALCRRAARHLFIDGFTPTNTVLLAGR